MRALVTGGAGFIGSHLVDRLLEDLHEVIILDNFSAGRWENISHHKGNRKINIFQVDISEMKSLTEYFEGVDWVFHLAALADIVPSIVNPLDYHKSNVDGTVNVLECSRKADVKRFVYTASSSCYGIPDTYPTAETAELRPAYPYALTKCVAEQYVMHWARVYKLPAVSVRQFNVYGPRSRTSGTYGAVFGTFLSQKLAQKPFTVVGDGTQTRDFTYVLDVVDVLIMLAKSSVSNEIFNIGSGKTYSINHLVKLLGGDVVYIPKRPGEPDCTFADITKITNMFGWRPKISIEEGVALILKQIDYWKDAPVWTPETIAKATGDWFKYLG